MKGQIHFAWFSGHGLGPGTTGWNDDRMPADMRWDRPDMYVEMTRAMERAGFDFVLFADTLGIPDVYKGSMDAYLEYAIAVPKMDPAVIAPMLGVSTQSIGIVPTLTTTYYPPYLLARLTSTLDHVLDGRAGWNIVTSASDRAAQNFGLDALPPHDHRYDVADEYLDVVRKLWASWEPDALVQDVRTGQFADPAKVHAIDHAGEYFRVRGPLNVSASPQRRPLLVQAGSSPRGVEFAGRHADVVITNRNTVAAMKDFRQKVRSAAEAAGRHPDDVKVMFIISPQLASSKDAVNVDHHTGGARLELGLAQLSSNLGLDMSKFPLDEPLTVPGSITAAQSTLDQFRNADGSLPALRHIAEQMGSWVSMPVVGTASQIADRLELIFDEVGGDGFAIRGNWIPSYVHDIATQVVGTLRRRGRVAPPAPGMTLRERVTGVKPVTV